MRVWLTRLVFLILLLCAAGAGWWYFGANGGDASGFTSATVQRGDLLVSISATGTVEPEEVIDVGAQVAGQILEFGKEKNGKTIDYGSAVDGGTVLARIDNTIYAADVAQARAQLAQAHAGVTRGQADLAQSNARLVQATRDWERAKGLGPSDALSQADYDASQAAYEVARANVGVSEAALAQDRQTIAVAEASVQRAKRNFDYCTITSPVKGVIIDRRVNIGQTVVASLNAPSLFLIAKDLTRMQVWVAVNEADIGSIRAGMPVTFTVDAYPGETFTGTVNKVRLNATMTQNVVTYTVEVTTDNSNGRLLPYLTANVQFHVYRHDDVLMVPNAALRWTPRTELIAPDARDSLSESRSGTQPAANGDAQQSRRGTLWIAAGRFVRPLRVQLGGSDGTNTQVQGEGVESGLVVVTGERTEAATASSGGNPFMPQMNRGRGGGGTGAGGRTR
ncbi:MAG: efflux RND transporter periplasmic adaptor subunit [Tepidisphaeraceae bacterium]